MKVRGGFEQSYNAQAAVEVFSMLVVGQHLTDQANDKQQLIPNLAALSPAVGQVGKVLVDTGYFSQAAALTAETGTHAPTVYAAMARQSHGRSVAQLEVQADPPPPPETATVAERMAHRLATAEGKQLYGLRKQTVEPVFGIIKQAIGFRRFLLRGQEKAGLEWTLVTTSYPCRALVEAVRIRMAFVRLMLMWARRPRSLRVPRTVKPIEVGFVIGDPFFDRLPRWLDRFHGLDVEGWRWWPTELDDTLPHAVKTEEKFDLLGAFDDT
jgi:hypothetical protein